MSDFALFEAGDVLLQSGVTLRGAKVAYKTYGRLDPARSNAILFPTRFSGRHGDNEFMIGAGKALDPERHFILVPNLLGNGLSSSPSNTPPPFDRARFPRVTIHDNVMLQRRLAAELFGIDRLALAVGWSMGAQQAYHWAALFPDKVERLCAIGGSARCSDHNYVFLEGVRSALMADAAFQDGWYDSPPEKGLRAMARVWAGWGLSQGWYRQGLYRQMGFATLEAFLVEFWEALFLQRDANNLLALIWTWQHADIAANDRHGGDFEKALGAIRARTIVMPGATDLYFPPEDSAYEAAHIAGSELRPIPSIWGHYAGGGRDPEANRFMDRALRDLLDG